MEYIIGLLMSSSGWIIGMILFSIAICFIFNKTKAIVFFSTTTLFILIYSSFLPSNTYKVKAEKIPNPTISQQHKEIQISPSLIEKGRSERKEHFDSLTDWKNRVQ